MNHSPPGEGESAELRAARARMVETQLVSRGIACPRVLAAMGTVPRHEFVAPRLVGEAYSDHALPIGHGVTISQPYVVALMSECLAIEPGERVLEIGAGSGYQSAVLAALGAEVFAIERIEALVGPARARLEGLGYGSQVHLRVGDGSLGWPENAPYAAILVAAAAPRIPQALVDELAPGGRLVIPVGTDAQELRLVRRRASREGSTSVSREASRRGDGGLSQESILPVRFVPLIGEGIGEGSGEGIGEGIGEDQ